MMKQIFWGILALVVIVAGPVWAQMGGMWGGGSGSMMHHGSNHGGEGQEMKHSEMSNKGMMSDKHMMYMMREWGGMMEGMSEMMNQGTSPEQMKEMSQMMRRMADEMEQMAGMMEKGQGSSEEMMKLHQSMMEMKKKIRQMRQQN
ncbi:hypothetical protein [Thermosulfuriphilus sp.]